MSPTDTAPTPSFQPAAAAMAFLAPGLGHLALKQPRRAVRIAAGILGLLTLGLLIGGVDAVDSKEDTYWFLAQACTGPLVIGVDMLHQNALKGDSPQNAIAARGIGRPNEIGALITAIAGLMNLLCIIDAAWNAKGRENDLLAAAGKNA